MLLPCQSLGSHHGYHIYYLGIAVPGFKKSPFYLIVALKHKSHNADNLDMLKRNSKVLSLSKMMKDLNLIRKEKVIC